MTNLQSITFEFERAVCFFADKAPFVKNRVAGMRPGRGAGREFPTGQLYGPCDSGQSAFCIAQTSC